MIVRRGILAPAALLLVLAPVAALAAAGSTAGSALYVGTPGEAALSFEPYGGAVRPVLPGAEELAETGRPVLPSRAIRLLVDPGSPITGLEIVPLQTRRVELPAPLALGEAEKTGEGIEVPCDRLEMGDDAYPTIWGEYGGSQVWRGFRFVSAIVYPVRALRDAEGRWTAVEVLERYEVRPVYGAGAAVPDIAQRQRLVPGERQWCESVLRRLCANPQALAGYAREDGAAVAAPPGGFQPTMTPSVSGSPVAYLIITRDALAAAFQPLADYKTSLGLPAKVVTIEWLEANYRHGVDPQETIRFFLREAYERWGLQYVLIGGDTDIVPARYATNTYYPIGGYTQIPTDLYFAGLDGNWNADGDWLWGEHYSSYLSPGDDADIAEDVFVGRAPVSTPAEVTTFINKVTSYEGAAAGSGWPGRVLFAAEVLFPPEYHPGDAISLDGAYFAQAIVDDYLNTCTTMSNARMFETYALTDTLGNLIYPGSVRLTRSALIDSLNSGHYGILNQIGHGFYFNMSVGDANFTVGDADALTNGDHTFLLYGLNCASAAFDYSCLMERMVQSPNGGSIASIGASRAAFPHTANNYQREFFRNLYCEGETRLGELIALSKLPYLPYAYTNTVDRWTIQNYTVLGDPSLSLWSGVPRAAQVTAPASLVGGQQSVTVTVNAGGAPVPGALVCLAKSGDDYASGTTGATGQVVLPFTATAGGQAVLTVSGPSLAHSTRNLPVNLGAGAYVRAESATVLDDGTAGTSGNGNGVAESGEIVALTFTFRNTGSAGSSAGSAQLVSGKAGVSILDATAVVGAIPAGGTLVASDPFLVQLAPDLADGEFLDFDLTVTAGGSYASEWRLTAEAPEVEPVELVWSDYPYGNGDGTLDNNERVTVRLDLKNFGAGRGDLITGRLRTLDPDVTIVDSLVTYSGIETVQRSSGSGLFSLREANVTTESWCWILFTDNYGRTFRHDFKLRPPTTPSGLETDPSLGPDVLALNWLPIRNLGVRGYNVYRADAPAGPFVRVNQDLLEWTSYFRDEGLGLLQRYYYRVTAVDSSLVEGSPCPAVSQSTAPPEQAGFPLPFAVETSNHLAVGDVNGDGIEEIVLAADEVYVWNSHGDEMVDGDNDAQTHGPITDLDTDFGLGGIALANLDGVPGLEIVVPERNSQGDDHNQVHVLRWDGTELPGWPQPLRATPNGAAWSVPAVGDVDGDGDLEIVLNTQDSRTYVWHADGTELRDGDGNPATNGVFVDRGNLYEYGKASPAICDLDGDGACEIIFGTNTTDNYLMAYRYDGSQAPGFPYPLGTETTLTSAAIADLDGDGQWEIVFNTRFSKLYVVRHDGGNYPGFPRTFGSGTAFNPSPGVGDFTGDGKLEIVAVATTSTLNSYIHVISTTGATSGQTLSGWPQSVPGNSESNPVVADIDGDGHLDVVFGIGGGNTESPNNLYAFHHDGTAIDGFPMTLGGPVRPTPVITDLDHDGDVDLVYGGWDVMIHVWDMPYAFDPHLAPWPTFRGHVHRDGVYRGDALVGVPAPSAPARLTLLPPTPNPFNPATRVRLFLPGATGAVATLEVGVYDLRGRLVRTLQSGPAATGWHDWIWDGRDGQGRSQPSGLYFLRARSERQTVVRKMSLVK